MALKETAQDYSRPYRPLLIKALNSFGRGLANVGLKTSLEQESLLNAARDKTKLSDFGKPDFSAALPVLLTAIEQEAELNPLGKFVTRKRLINVLKNRLRFTKLQQEHPEINELKLPPVILITGLQRTGTTLLHRLLAADPKMRALQSWEAIQPTPILDNPKRDRKKRRALAALGERSLAYLAPDFFAIHPVEADAPEEDVLLLDYSFLSTVPEATMHVPSYTAWLEQRDHTPAYELLIALLKLLFWQQPAPYWVLKSPHHLEFLDIILQLFPELTVVQTHRDPAITLPSFCSMMAHSRGIFSDRVDPKQIGAEWLRKTVHMVNKGLLARKQAKRNCFVDIYYDELLKAPLTEVERIYALAKIDLAPSARAKMEASLNVNVQHRFGVHRYRLQDFGLTREVVYRAYAEYLHYFDVPLGRAA